MTPEGPSSLDASRFQPHVGSTFTVDSGDPAPIELTLTGVEVPPGLDEGDVCFSLLFNGPAGTPLDQRIHQLHHGELGALELFVVPIGPTPDGLAYEVVFNNPAAVRELLL